MDGNEARRVIDSCIKNCAAMQPRFGEGTSQHTLLKNRIHALEIAGALLGEKSGGGGYSKEELLHALPPILSIAGKCRKAQGKFSAGSARYTRLQDLIDAMDTAGALLEQELEVRG